MKTVHGKDRKNKGDDPLVRLVSAAERTISLLKERRAALIAAAVTGQIEIKGVNC